MAVKHDEPLVRTSVTLAERQFDGLMRKAREERYSLSHYVREAIDAQYPELVPDDAAAADPDPATRPERATA